MAQAIVTVLILIVLVLYAVLFSLWNPMMIEVVGWNWWPQQLWANVPMFLLPLAGLAIGAIVMAIAISAPWSSLKSRLAATEDQLDAERSRSRECQEKVQALRSRLQKAQVQGAHPAPVAITDQTPGDAGDEEI